MERSIIKDVLVEAPVSRQTCKNQSKVAHKSNSSQCWVLNTWRKQRGIGRPGFVEPISARGILTWFWLNYHPPAGWYVSSAFLSVVQSFNIVICMCLDCDQSCVFISVWCLLVLVLRSGTGCSLMSSLDIFWDFWTKQGSFYRLINVKRVSLPTLNEILVESEQCFI